MPKYTPFVQQHRDALDKFDQGPLLGTHTIGDLTLTVGTRNWQLKDARHYIGSGRTSDAPKTRYAVRSLVLRWLKLQNR